ncbi:alpha,alpha-trehalose-phosphate synthase (UDP-forming) [Pantoea agglomerans]|uniref:alpha,alpha-trehalose-phosphate synthase (UDP-forming) n=1 Tax=Enterobacter agglomerans TaxID=549 RepID=UPI003208EFC5
MSKLVVISNRTADPDESRSGGLAVALWSTLKQSGGTWIGWDGRVCSHDNPEMACRRAEGVDFFTTELTGQEYKNFYIGYANSVLWPVFHNRTDLAEHDPEFKLFYERTIRRVASSCFMQISAGDVVWVHDYQMITCGAELRKKGIKNSIGFFLHIPFPPPELIRCIPDHAWLITSLLSYDLVGFQTEKDFQNFHKYIMNHTDAELIGEKTFFFKGRKIRAGVFPIGIDTGEILQALESERSRELNKRFRREGTGELIVGVDSLDYSKGLPQRIHSIREFFARCPDKKKAVSLLQIAAPSREKVTAYEKLSDEMNYLSGKINGDLGDMHWSPVSYVHRNVERDDLPVIYRNSRVGLVTPLCDGMNLVAKEYVVSQDPDNPGVLILSEFAGAAHQLADALLVNPFDAGATARAIEKALNMPLEERKSRHTSLMRSILDHDVHWWCGEFLNSLKEQEIWMVA